MFYSKRQLNHIFFSTSRQTIEALFVRVLRGEKPTEGDRWIDIHIKEFLLRIGPYNNGDREVILSTL